MHLLYLDDSGSVANAADKHIVLAGFSVFERQSHWLAQKLDEIASRVWPDNPAGLEFRGADILNGKKLWRGVKRDVREAAYREALIAVSAAKGSRLFGAAIYKSAVLPKDPMEVAFEHVASRFDRMLGRLHNAGDTQRGLIVLDESSYEGAIQRLSTVFRTEGHSWGRLYNLAEVPMFVDSKATRLIQCADLIAHAVRRYYERGQSDYFDHIRTKFDSVGGAILGLTHFVPAGDDCPCIVCIHKPRRREPLLPF